jgi:hypothetical protein
MQNVHEEKLVELLKVAITNGWSFPIERAIIRTEYKNGDEYIVGVTITNVDRDLYENIPLDLLIGEWYDGRASFLEGLCEALIWLIDSPNFTPFSFIFGNGREIWINTPQDLTADIVRAYWFSMPTPYRLNWLLEFFEPVL